MILDHTIVGTQLTCHMPGIKGGKPNYTLEVGTKEETGEKYDIGSFSIHQREGGEQDPSLLTLYGDIEKKRIEAKLILSDSSEYDINGNTGPQTLEINLSLKEDFIHDEIEYKFNWANSKLTLLDKCNLVASMKNDLQVCNGSLIKEDDPFILFTITNGPHLIPEEKISPENRYKVSNQTHLEDFGFKLKLRTTQKIVERETVYLYDYILYTPVDSEDPPSSLISSEPLLYQRNISNDFSIITGVEKFKNYEVFTSEADSTKDKDNSEIRGYSTPLIFEQPKINYPFDKKIKLANDTISNLSVGNPLGSKFLYLFSNGVGENQHPDLKFYYCSKIKDGDSEIWEPLTNGKQMLVNGQNIGIFWNADKIGFTTNSNGIGVFLNDKKTSEFIIRVKAIIEKNDTNLLSDNIEKIITFSFLPVKSTFSWSNNGGKQLIYNSLARAIKYLPDKKQQTIWDLETGKNPWEKYASNGILPYTWEVISDSTKKLDGTSEWGLESEGSEESKKTKIIHTLSVDNQKNSRIVIRGTDSSSPPSEIFLTINYPGTFTKISCQELSNIGSQIIDSYIKADEDSVGSFPYLNSYKNESGETINTFSGGSGRYGCEFIGCDKEGNILPTTQDLNPYAAICTVDSGFLPNLNDDKGFYTGVDSYTERYMKVKVWDVENYGKITDEDISIKDDDITGDTETPYDGSITTTNVITIGEILGKFKYPKNISAGYFKIPGGVVNEEIQLQFYFNDNIQYNSVESINNVVPDYWPITITNIADKNNKIIGIQISGNYPSTPQKEQKIPVFEAIFNGESSPRTISFVAGEVKGLPSEAPERLKEEMFESLNKSNSILLTTTNIPYSSSNFCTYSINFDGSDTKGTLWNISGC